jgi:hypothetical protein
MLTAFTMSARSSGNSITTRWRSFLSYFFRHVRSIQSRHYVILSARLCLSCAAGIQLVLATQRIRLETLNRATGAVPVLQRGPGAKEPQSSMHSGNSVPCSRSVSSTKRFIRPPQQNRCCKIA